MPFIARRRGQGEGGHSGRLGLVLKTLRTKGEMTKKANVLHNSSINNPLQKHSPRPTCEWGSNQSICQLGTSLGEHRRVALISSEPSLKFWGENFFKALLAGESKQCGMAKLSAIKHSPSGECQRILAISRTSARAIRKTLQANNSLLRCVTRGLRHQSEFHTFVEGLTPELSPGDLPLPLVCFRN